MIIHPAEQGSVEWSIARAGIPTASEFDQLVTPEFKIRMGEMPLTYLAKKVSEAWLGGPLASLNIFDMEQGNILEEEALPFYSLTFDEEIKRVGLCLTDDGLAGCSPDGLIGEEGGIEIKCPLVQTHVRYLLSGGLPKDYAAQVHGSMYVTGRPWWKFMSYCRGLPPLVLTIHRDEKIQKIIHDALDLFHVGFREATAKMEAMNGGPPKRRKIEPKPVEQFVSHEPT